MVVEEESGKVRRSEDYVGASLQVDAAGRWLLTDIATFTAPARDW